MVKRELANQEEYNIRKDISLWFLILSNIIIIILAVIQKWEIGIILWIYFIQTLIIGFFVFARILNLKEYSTINYYLNGKQPIANKKTKYLTAFFFLALYTIFQLGYLIFLIAFFISSFINNLSTILLTSLIFLVNHSFSYFYNRKRDQEKIPTISTIVFIPILRIFPMHLIIVTGLFLSNIFGLVFFLVLKTIFDGIMHIVEHTPQKQITKGSLKESTKNKKIPALIRFLIKLNMRNLPEDFPKK